MAQREKNHFDAIDQLLKCLEGKLKKKIWCKLNQVNCDLV